MQNSLNESATNADYAEAINWQSNVFPQLKAQCLSEYDAADCLHKTKQSCIDYCSSLGYDYIAYAGYFPIGDIKHDFSHFPDNFVSTPATGLKELEVLIQKQCKNRTAPFGWNDIPTDSGKTSDQLKELLRKAESNNIHNGVCIPIHGAGAEQGMLNVAHSSKYKAKAEDNLRFLQFHAMGIHEAVKACSDRQTKGMSKTKALSPRERECLDWIAAGKTAWETAKIVGITESTVSFHIRNTIQKLNASNRSHAVAIAMACSLISNSPK